MSNRRVCKRILHITPFFSPNIGGVESHLDDLCNYLQKRGHFQYVLTFNPLTTNVKAPQFEKSNNMEVYRFRWPGNNLFHKLEPYPFLEFLYLSPYLFLRSIIFMLFKHRKIDVLHAHGLNSAFVVKLLKKLFKKKAIMSTYAIYNLDPDSFFSRGVAWTLSTFDEIQALANPSKDELLKIGIKKEKIRIYYLWVDPDDFKPIEKKAAKEKLGYSGKFLVLFVGRLIPIKGPRNIMEVAKSLPGIHFVFIGDGPLAEELRNEAEEFSNIEFIGRVERDILKKFYNAADIFVLPSCYEEAFGKVAIEAFFSGTPVIGSKRGAIPDVIARDVGRVIEPTIENFRNEIEYLYNNIEQLAMITRNCRNYAMDHFTQRNAKVIEEGYYD